MISDLYPPEKRATAMGTYAAGINIGVLGFLVGGWIDEWYGWRIAFLLLACRALFSAFNVFHRQRTSSHAAPKPMPKNIRGSMGHVQNHDGDEPAPYRYRHTLVVFVGYGALYWNGVYFRRILGLSAGPELYWR